MPIKSKAQRRLLHSQKPELAKEFEAHTPKGKKLPEKKGKPKSRVKGKKSEKCNGFKFKAKEGHYGLHDQNRPYEFTERR